MSSFTNFIFRRTPEGDAMIVDPAPTPATAVATPVAEATAVPTNGMVSLEGSQQRVAAEAGTETKCVVGAKVRAEELDETENESTRKPLDLVVVLDTSGSMSGSKLRMCQETCAFLLSELRAEDRFAVVEYNTVVRTRLPLSHADDAFKQAARSTIDDMRATGSTNLSGGLFQGLSLVMREDERKRSPVPAPVEEDDDMVVFSNVSNVANVANVSNPSRAQKKARKARSWFARNSNGADEKEHAAKPAAAYDGGADRVRSVLLLTDGQANNGITDPQQLSRACSSMIDGTSISLFTFGYGEDHNADLLRSLAESGRGNYYFVANNDEVADAFADCLGGLLTVVAQNVTLRIAPQAPYTVSRVVSRRKVREASGEQSTGVTCELGDLYAGESLDFLVELTVPARDAPVDSEPLAALSLDFVNIRARDASLERLDEALTIARPAELSAEQSAYECVDLEAQLLREETVAAMEEATRLADAHDLAAARQELERVRQQTTVMSAKLCEAGAAQEQIDLICHLQNDVATLSEGVASESVYHKGGRLRAKNMQMNHMQQRGWSPASEMEEEVQTYSKAGKSRMKAKSKAWFSSA
mmetsp:Transcript_35872/g.112612  ORF Transcript_35872/g.112612 Transcript_35872/m.112612 type:complete len:588 (-) Transcript_35872:881-2644(-)|eukprot:CAMPEP_0118886964 /NCGR_PEP_ID=MMETSP1163-20130328/24855_1 /TAXON_ID=124430 /ORGANISM="Phaeomonas parva, Strain CCMP2877" /LENGTH=587 /DNA_ID=CAMNT_0006825295 /DNA_START=136 /DNA_END=1899 /DNA_ORIENTATION=+